MANMKDFLTTYYSRLIFREMSHEQFVQFCGYIKDKKATDTQKVWAEELLKKDPATGEFETVSNTNIYIPKDLPDVLDTTGEGLSDEEWEKLFKAFQSAFQSMDGSKSDFKYNEKATKFLEQYFGSHTATGGTSVYHMFQPEKIKPSVVPKLYNATHEDDPATLYGFLKKYEHILKPRFQGGYYSILEDNFSYKDLLDGIKSGKYNTKSSFRKKLEAVAGYIEGYKSELYTNGIPHGAIPDFSDYEQWYDNRIDPFRLDQFKHEYADLLNTLREEPKIREVFAKHDGGKITGPLNKALEIQSYDNPESEDYIQPKREESMTIPETIAEWWGDTYSNCLEKYAKLRGDRLFFSKEAKVICKYLQKNLKKTDGLDGVLKNIGDAKAKLKAAREFKANKHLGWFEKTMTEIKNDPKMEKAWKKGLRNGTAMRAIVKELIIRAVNDKDGPKIDEAKTALELISVLHYEYTTSNIMDALAKTDITIFSDGKLSFNKNDGMKLITTALDKGIKTAIQGIGYAITIGANAINMSGRKITQYSDKKGKGNFKSEHDQYLRGLDAKKQDLEDKINAERTHRTNTQATIDTIRGTRTYDQAKTDIETNLGALSATADTEKQNLNNLVQQMASLLEESNPTTGAMTISDTDDRNAIEEFLSKIINNETPTIPVLHTPSITTLAGTTVDLGTLLHDTLIQYNRNSTAITNRDNEQNKLNNLVNGTELVNQLSEQITRHQEEYDNWDTNHRDAFKELSNYWNRLETGRNTHTGPMYNWFRHLNAKKAQEDLNARSASIMAAYNNSHSIAA